MADTRKPRSQVVTVKINDDIVVEIDFRRGLIRVSAPADADIRVDPPARETRMIAQYSTKVN